MPKIIKARTHNSHYIHLRQAMVFVWFWFYFVLASLSSLRMLRRLNCHWFPLIYG